jgi:hypothetical protein
MTWVTLLPVRRVTRKYPGQLSYDHWAARGTGVIYAGVPFGTRFESARAEVYSITVDIHRSLEEIVEGIVDALLRVASAPYAEGSAGLTLRGTR